MLQALSKVRLSATTPRHLCRLLSLHVNETGEKTRDEEVKPYEQIPGKRFWGLNAFELLRSGGLAKNILPYFEKRYKLYGPIYRDNANPSVELLLVVNTHDAEVLLRNEAKYPRRLIHLGMSEFFEKKKKLPGVFFAEGEHWYKHRTVVSKRMLRPKEMREYTPDINEIVTEFIGHIRQAREPSGSLHEYEVRDLDNSLFRWAFEGVNKFVLDRRFGALQEPMPDPRGQEFINSLLRFLSAFIDVQIVPISVNAYYETKAYRTFMDSLMSLYTLTEAFLQEAVEDMKLHEDQGEKQEGRVPFLRYLLQSGSLEEKDLIASIVDIVFAGVDTTSNTMHWCLYLLGKNPEKLKKLEEEVNTLLKPGEQATYDDLQRTPYLKAVIKETLRLYPAATQLPRITPEDMVLSGYRVPAGTQVFVDFYIMARNPDLFPDPEAFIPERWFEETSEQTRFASLPFGFGVRMCVGRRLAELEMHLLLARLVQEFKMVNLTQEDIPIWHRGLPIPEKNVPIKFYDR